jgi:F420-non-reducing hydrogenase small subunit
VKARAIRSDEIFGTLFPKGAVVCREGERGHALYVVQSGAVEVSRQTGNGRVVVALLERGEFFGEMALVDDEVRSATVTAVADSRLLAITRRSFRERVRTDPGVALRLLRTLSLRIERTRMLEDLEAAESVSEGARLGRPVVPPSEDLVEYPPGATVFRQGEPGESMVLVVEGALEVVRDHEGDAQVLARLGPGDICGEMAVLTGRPRAATVVATVPSRLLVIRRDELLARLRGEPDLALHIVQILVLRLRGMLGATGRGRRPRVARRLWPAVSTAARPLRTAVVSLSSCGGCAAVLLESRFVVSSGSNPVEVVYCPMLMDEGSLPEVELAIVDGAVRCKEDVERLEEARAKSRYLVGLGSCATSGGIPALANRFALEDLLEGSFGRTQDVFDHYLDGTRAANRVSASVEPFQLLRKVSPIGAVVRVDDTVPGCPPPVALLERLFEQLAGRPVDPAAVGKEPKTVCSECGRTPRKSPADELRDFPGRGTDPASCLASCGVICLGFVTRGGCGATCPGGGLPCWGCRGATTAALRKIAEGDTVDSLALDGLSKMSKLDPAKVRPGLRATRTAGLSVLGIGQPPPELPSRLR